MVKAPSTPGTYLLQTLDPNSGEVKASVSPYRDSNFPNGIDSGLDNHPGTVLIFPAHVPLWVPHPVQCVAQQQFKYPITLATIEVSGATKRHEFARRSFAHTKGSSEYCDNAQQDTG